MLSALTWLVPLFFLVFFPVAAIHDYLAPWNEEVNNLEIQKPNNFRLLVGFTGYSAHYFGDEKYEIERMREWVLFPSVFTEPHTYRYYKFEIKEPEERVKFLDLNQINKNGALHYFFIYLAAYCFCWFVSKPKIQKWYQQRSGP